MKQPVRKAGVLPPSSLFVASVVSVFVTLVLSPVSAEETGPVLTLSQALRDAATRSAAATEADLDAAAAREAVRMARAAYYPSISVSANQAFRDHEVVAVFGTVEVPTTQKNFFSAQIEATQLLWDAGRRAANLSGAQSAARAARERGRAAIVGAQLDTLASYLKVLVLEAQQRVVQQRISSLEEHHRLAQDLYDRGLVARNDLLGTEVRLRTIKDQLAQTVNSTVTTRAALGRLIGRDIRAPLALLSSLPKPEPLLESTEELRRLLPERNPRLAILRNRLEAELAAVNLHRSERLPSAFAQLAHTYQQNQYLAYPNASIFFLGLSWRAWEGGLREAQTRQAAIASEKTRSEIADLTKALEIDADQAARDFEEARREAESARLNIEAAVENLRIQEDQYRAGIARTSDVLDAEAILAESRFSLVNQHYTAYLKKGLLLALSGVDLPPAFDNLESTPLEP